MAEEAGGGALRELLAVFGFGVDTKELEKGKDKLGEFLETLKGIAEKIAVAFAVDQVYEFAEGQARAMNAIERTGAQLGITTDRVQEFRFAAKSLGLEADALLNSMGRLQVSQQAAAQGSGIQSKAFHQLGVNVKDASGHFKGADALMLDVADGISKMQDPSQQAAAAVALFGRSGRELLPFLKQGKDGVEDYFKTFKELGGGYDEEALKAGKEFDKQSAKTNLTLTALKNTIAKALLPIVTAISKGVQSAAKWFNILAKNSYIVQVALAGLATAATAFAISMAIAFAPVLLIAAGIGLLLLAVEDLVTFLTGGESETGDLLDKIFGKGTQIDVLEKLRDTWGDIRDTFEELSQWVHKTWMEFKNFIDNADRIGVVLRAITTGKNVTEALAKHEVDKVREDSGPSEDAKTFYRRVNAVKHGRVFQADGETEEQAKLAASIITTQNPSLSPYYGPQPMIPGSGGAGGGSDHTVKVQVDAGPGFEAHVTSVTKKERRAAAATMPRAGQ